MRNYSKYIKLILLLGFVLLLAFGPTRKYISIERLTSLIEEIKNNPFAPLIFLFIYIAGVVLALPGTALTILAAPIFGFWKGLLLVIVAANIGCQITFFISRFFGAGFIQRFIKTDSKIGKLSGRLEKNGFMFMLYLRLLPIFPFNAINYLSGLTKIKYKDYALATLFGMLPGTCVYVYLSFSASDIKNNPYGILISLGVLTIFTLIVGYFKKKRKSEFGEE